MKTHALIPVAGLILLLPVARAGDQPPSQATYTQTSEVTVTTPDSDGPRVERRIEMMHPGPREMITVAFLGVETGPVDLTLSSQLGVAPGTGLVVHSIVPDSAAAAALQEHDVLLKLNDQILIDTHQLSVLVRNMKKGDKITLSFLRGGKAQTAEVTLGEHQVPKRDEIRFLPRPNMGFDFRTLDRSKAPVVGEGDDANHLLWMMDLGRDGRQKVVRNREVSGDQVVEVTVNTGDGMMNYNDDKGSLELVSKEGRKMLTAKDAAGKVIYEGPVSTPEERAKLPQEVRERLKKIEDMQSFQFRTDKTFKGGETRMIAPQRQDVSALQPANDSGLRRLDI